MKLNSIIRISCLTFFLFPRINFAQANGTDSFKKLPIEMNEEILSHLPLKELEKLNQTNHHFHEIIARPGFYNYVVKHHPIYDILRSPLFRKESLLEISTHEGRARRIHELLDTSTEFAQVDAGVFKMGSPQFLAWREHDVYLDSYLIQKYAVTQLLWYLVMQGEQDEHGVSLATPSHFKSESDCLPGDHLILSPQMTLCMANPVESVSWYTVMNHFLPKLETWGVKAFLPTEAQWERAVRGKKTTEKNFYSPYYFGSIGKYYETLDQYAWYIDNSDKKPQRVGQKLPNSLGLFDMIGNVRQWVQDCYEPFDITGTPSNPQRNPTPDISSVCPGGSFSNDRRAARGTSWLDYQRADYESGSRGSGSASKSYSSLGFRLVIRR
jgi:formylglycine-generating enzyme required for sulfatase activity